MAHATRRDFLRTAGLGALAARFASAAARKPNIVMILADDLGYEALGCYGGTSYKTPVLDQLAASGVRFTHAYAQPLCTPTRLQLMTGKYNFRNWLAFGLMDPKERTFGHLMGDLGYKTCIAGKWQFWSYNPPDYEPEWRAKGKLAKDAGFDEWCLWHTGHTEDKGSRYADPVVEENGSVKKLDGGYGPDVYTGFINRFIEKHRSEPFFVYYPMALTHGPFNPTPRSADWASGNRLKSDKKYFRDMVEYMDLAIGRVVSKLDELGLRENTLILYFSDNGTPLGITSMMGSKAVAGGKGMSTDAGTRVPCIANWKGVTRGGVVSDDLIDSTDFLPTMLEAAGAKLPKGYQCDGRSFLPRLQGKKGNPREAIYLRHDPRPGWDKKQFRLTIFARDQRYKLYSDGRLYHIPADELEQHPITMPDTASQKARRKLQAVIDRMKAEGA